MTTEANPKSEKSLTAFSRRTISEILKTWGKIKSITRRAVTGKVDPDLSSTDEEHIKKQIHECIFARGGEISSRARSVELGKIYLNLSLEGRQKFMRILSREFDVDRENIDHYIEEYKQAKSESQRLKAEIELSKILVPPRVKLLRQFNTLPNGFKFLIDLRAELLPIRKDDPYLKKLDSDLKNILSSWFDIGLLDLKEITWQSPAALLEKLIEYEAVHEIRSWADLKNRLDSDRHCFAFFHNKIPDEPLIFVEIALVNEMSDSIQKLLDEEAKTIKPEEADTAIFYSISNAQSGLTGIHLGDFLIKRVVNELSKKLKNLKHFATLSPVPNFRKWLEPFLLKGDDSILLSHEIKAIQSISVSPEGSRGLLELLNMDWAGNELVSSTLKPILMRLVAHYLLNIKKGDRAFDPVAHFHLANGAYIERLNWLGDVSEKGINQSGTIMVNYYYKLSEIEKNHEQYITESIIHASRDVKKWIK